MPQPRLRSIMILIIVIAVSIWAGMQIERARTNHRVIPKLKIVRSRHLNTTYTVVKPIRQVQSEQAKP